MIMKINYQINEKKIMKKSEIQLLPKQNERYINVKDLCRSYVEKK